MEISFSTLTAVYKNELDVVDLRKQTNASTATSIPRVSQPITYEEFFTEYLLPNQACVLGAWATATWRSRQDWVLANSRPNIDFLKENFGDDIGPVADCSQVEYNAHPKVEMPVADFLTQLKSGFADGQLLYLKDWHLQRQFPHYQGYKTPPYFTSDWMNEFWDIREDLEDDYRFVYVGPKGSWTPFHSDVLQSYSWSANICGRKKWIFFLPGEEEKLRNDLGKLPFDLSSVSLKDCRCFEVYQEIGEIVYVPSGWYHQVHNLEDTISINHNWFNGCNTDLTWLHLVDSERSVQEEIADCRGCMNDEEWNLQCRLMLKACTGIDYHDFYDIMHTIAHRRMSALQPHIDSVCATHQGAVLNTPENIGTTDSQGGVLKYHQVAAPCAKNNHRIFDLIQIRKIVLQMSENAEFLESDEQKFPQPPELLLKNITKIVEVYFSIYNPK